MSVHIHLYIYHTQNTILCIQHTSPLYYTSPLPYTSPLYHTSPLYYTSPLHYTSLHTVQTHRYVLGSYPKDERSRLAETLTRILTRQIATKAVLKMRTSSGVEVADYWWAKEFSFFLFLPTSF